MEVLWLQWWKLVLQLRSACSRKRSFLWLATSLAGFCVREDLAGVTSLVRALGLRSACYDRLLDFFHSSAVEPARLAKCWTSVVLKFVPGLLRLDGRLVLLADGIKVPKAGRKMPAVKRLKQTESNTKPEYINGHSCQAISVVASSHKSAFAVPLGADIHEGVVFSNRDKRTLPKKLLSLLSSLGISEPVTLVADAFYACRTVAAELLKAKSHLVSRVRSNAVAFYLAEPPRKPKRGRPRLYGSKVKLRSLFDCAKTVWVSAQSPVYAEQGVVLRYAAFDLIWRPLRRQVRFVLVDHPVRGKITLICTDLAMAPLDVIALYGVRFKIELSFKQALRVIGAYAYHFWMAPMKPLSRRNSGDQYLHHETDDYRDAVRRKLAAYRRYIQVALIAQGLLQYLCIACTQPVWDHFGSWLRTIRPGIPPTEQIARTALRNTLCDFLSRNSDASSLTKFLRDRIDLHRDEGLRLVA